MCGTTIAYDLHGGSDDDGTDGENGVNVGLVEKSGGVKVFRQGQLMISYRPCPRHFPSSSLQNFDYP